MVHGLRICAPGRGFKKKVGLVPVGFSDEWVVGTYVRTYVRTYAANGERFFL